MLWLGCKIPKISPGASIFKSPFGGAYFWRGLYLEGPLFGGAYLRSESCVSKSIGLACSGKEIYHFCFVLLCIRGQIPSTSPPGGLYSEGRFNGGFFALRFWGAYTWRGLFSEFYGICVIRSCDFCRIRVNSSATLTQWTRKPWHLQLRQTVPIRIRNGMVDKEPNCECTGFKYLCIILSLSLSLSQFRLLLN